MSMSDLMHTVRRIDTLRSWVKIFVWAVHTFISLNRILGAIARPLRPHRERPVCLLLSAFWDTVFTKLMEFIRWFRGSSLIWWLWFRLGKFLFGHLRCHQEILFIVLTVTDVPRVWFQLFAKLTLRLAISSIDLSQKWWRNNCTRGATLCLGFCHPILNFQNAAAQVNGPGDLACIRDGAMTYFLYTCTLLLCNKNLIGHFPMQHR